MYTWGRMGDIWDDQVLQLDYRQAPGRTGGVGGGVIVKGRCETRIHNSFYTVIMLQQDLFLSISVSRH